MKMLSEIIGDNEERWIAQARKFLDEEAEERKSLISNIDKKTLRALCLEYDSEQGGYPEHEYEGYAVFRFFCQCLEVEKEKNKG